MVLGHPMLLPTPLGLPIGSIELPIAQLRVIVRVGEVAAAVELGQLWLDDRFGLGIRCEYPNVPTDIEDLCHDGTS